jgi:hypothetical protein
MFSSLGDRRPTNLHNTLTVWKLCTTKRNTTLLQYLVVALGWDSSLKLQPQWAYCTNPRQKLCVWSTGDREKWQHLHQCHLSTSNATRTNLGFKLCLHSKKPVNNATLLQQFNLVGYRILLHASFLKFGELHCEPTTHFGLPVYFSALQHILICIIIIQTGDKYNFKQFTNTPITLCITTKWKTMLTHLFDLRFSWQWILRLL